MKVFITAIGSCYCDYISNQWLYGKEVGCEYKK